MDPVKAIGHLINKVVEAIPQELKETEAQKKYVENLAFIMGATQRFSFPPIAAFLGGVVS